MNDPNGRLTEEQQAIVYSGQGNMKVNAFAGSGKTFTLMQYALNKPEQNKMYVCFNKSIQIEAERQLAEYGVRKAIAKTMHSLAYGSVIIGEQFPKPVSRISVYDIVKQHGLPYGKDGFILAIYALKVFESFCCSDCQSLDEFDYSENIDTKSALLFFENSKSTILGIANSLWSNMVNKKIRPTHSFYLKYYQLSKPNLSCDIILLDEAQDVNPVILDIILSQNCTRVIVGDTHQQIYAWRGAINSLEKLDYDTFWLSSSFRFGQRIADVCNKVLQWKEGLALNYEPKNILGLGSNSRLSTKCILSRTNIEILKRVLSEKGDGDGKFSLSGSFDDLVSIGFGATVEDLYYFLVGDRGRCKSNFLNMFKGGTDLIEYAETVEDMNLLAYVKFVSDYGASIFGDMAVARNNIVSERAGVPNYSTVHKAKGREWDSVTVISNQHNTRPVLTETKKNGGRLSEREIETQRTVLCEEVNIAYVACSRARTKLEHPYQIDEHGEVIYEEQ
jgi:hypothetical protein